MYYVNIQLPFPRYVAPLGCPQKLDKKHMKLSQEQGNLAGPSLSVQVIHFFTTMLVVLS